MRDTSSPSSVASSAGTEQTRLMFATLGGGVEVVPVASVVSIEIPGHAPDCVRLEFMPSEPGEPAWLHRGEVQQLRDYLTAMLAQWPTEKDVEAFLDAPDDQKMWRPAPQMPLLMVDSFPRRNRVDHWSPAERAIQKAVDAVEATGADVALTDAVVLLGKAKDRVADYVDAQIRARSATPASSDVLTEQPTQANCANRTTPADPLSGAELPAFGRFRPKRVMCPMCSGSWHDSDLDDNCPVAYSHHLLRGAPVPPSSSIAASETATTARPCTCHPADNPPRPCAEKYALSDCRPSADPSVTTDAETVNLPGWCLYCGGTYRTFAPGLAGCDNRECVRHPYINEANAAKKAAAWRGTPESSPAVPLCSQCGKHDARFACTDFLGAPAVDAGTTETPRCAVDDETPGLIHAIEAVVRTARWHAETEMTDHDDAVLLQRDCDLLESHAVALRAARRSPESTPSASETRAEDRNNG